MTNRDKPVILTFVWFYLPGYRSGGPVRSVSNLSDRLSDEFRFRIVTLDRDSGDETPYPGIRRDQWNAVGKAEVMYLSPRGKSWRFIRDVLRETPHDAVYLNSFFNYSFTIIPMMISRMHRMPAPVLLAPRGELSPGALAIRHARKRLFLSVAAGTGLTRHIRWHATSHAEETDIRSRFGDRARVFIAPNIGPAPSRAVRDAPGKHDPLKIVFLSRLTEKKNLDGAIRMLASVTVPVEMTVYGTMREQDYVDRCRRLIRELPSHIHVDIAGPVPHEEVIRKLRDHDLFFFPTRGENFGHAIAEAFMAGCPVLISDRTPFRDLEKKGVGWDIPLECPDRFREVIENLARMDAEPFQGLRKRVAAFGLAMAENDENVMAHRRMLRALVSTGRSESPAPGNGGGQLEMSEQGIGPEK